MNTTTQTFTNVPIRNRIRTARALHHLKRLKRLRREYEESVRDWYERGDGRPPRWRVELVDDELHRWNAGGKGYRYPCCIHGTSLWTDYDNICGPCEDGLSDYEMALALARDDWHDFEGRMALHSTAVTLNAPDEIRNALRTWALDALGFPTKEEQG